MAECGNCGLFYGYSTADATLLTLCKSCFGTGCILAGNYFESMCCKVAIFLAANRTDRLAAATCRSALTFVLTANCTVAVNKVMLCANELGKNNIIGGDLYKLVTVLNVKLLASYTGVELYVAGSVIGRSKCRMSLSLTGIIVVSLNETDFRKYRGL